MKLEEVKNQQTALEFIVQKLFKQKEKSQNFEGSCFYRGPNGTKCAVGWLIPDRDYLTEFDYSTSSVPNLYKLEEIAKAAHLEYLEISFLVDVQALHDESVPPFDHMDFKQEAALFAEKYSLSSDFLDRLKYTYYES